MYLKYSQYIIINFKSLFTLFLLLELIIILLVLEKTEMKNKWNKLRNTLNSNDWDNSVRYVVSDHWESNRQKRSLSKKEIITTIESFDKHYEKGDKVIVEKNISGQLLRVVYNYDFVKNICWIISSYEINGTKFNRNQGRFIPS